MKFQITINRSMYN